MYEGIFVATVGFVGIGIGWMCTRQYYINLCCRLCANKLGGKSLQKAMKRNERTAEQRKYQTIDGIHRFTTEAEHEERREALKDYKFEQLRGSEGIK